MLHDKKCINAYRTQTANSLTESNREERTEKEEYSSYEHYGNGLYWNKLYLDMILG
jgi:hypothetical protein